MFSAGEKHLVGISSMFSIRLANGFTKKDGAKRPQQIFNLQSSIFISGLQGLGVSNK
jgi:hypothetical protein